MVVTQGDIFFVDFNPSIAHEQRNKRLAIVLSHDLVARFGGLTIVAPISTTKREYPTYHSLKSTRVIKGKVMLNQTLVLDLKVRGGLDIEKSI